MKVIANVLFFLDGMLFVPWPLLSLFVLAFAFDDPNKGFSAANIAGVLIFITYPVGFVKAWRAKRRALREGADWCTSRNVGLLALPYAHFGVIALLAYISGGK